MENNSELSAGKVPIQEKSPVLKSKLDILESNISALRQQTQEYRSILGNLDEQPLSWEQEAERKEMANEDSLVQPTHVERLITQIQTLEMIKERNQEIINHFRDIL